MSKVIDHVKRKYPDKRILIWDDMLRKIPEETIKFGADSLVRFSEPVVWNYCPEPEQSLNDFLWQKYSRLFPAVWIATAFKGNMNESICFSSCRFTLFKTFMVENELGVNPTKHRFSSFSDF
jgi:hypothetical protein